MTDTGPVVALIDPDDMNHDRCWEAMRNLPQDAIVTPIACLAEVLYLLGKAGGHPFQSKVWTMVESGIVRLWPETITDCVNVGQLMEKYKDIPMDFADGVVVVAADILNVDMVFTIDKHFYAYRKSNGDAFTVIPG